MTDLIIRNGKADSVSKVPIVNWFKISKMMEGRKNYKKDGCVSFVPSQSNLELWKQAFPSSKIDDQDAKVKEFEAYVVAERPQFAFRRDPLPHQSKAFKQFENSKLSAVFGSVGSGKTKIGIDIFTNAFCQGKIDAVIVIAINKLVTKQWHEKQLERDVSDNVQWSSWLWDKSKKGLEAYEQLKSFDGLQIVCINVDALRTDPGINLLKDFIARHKGRLQFVVDESQTVKNPSAQRTKNVLELSKKCDYRMIMSGTPIAVNLIDYWSQFKILDENIIGCKYVSSFKSKYTITRWNGFTDEIIGSKNTDELYAKTAPYVFRITKEELGFRDFDDEFEFEMGPQEKKHYSELKKTFMTQLDSGEFLSVSNALSALTRLQQVSGGLLLQDDGTFKRLECSRLAAFKSWAEMVEDEKLVVWCRYLAEANLLKEMLGSEAIDISGNVSQEERYDNVQTFINDNSRRFCIGTPKASGVGVDGLNVATNRAVFYSNSEHSLDYYQARGRTSRVGGDKNAFYLHILGRGTVDRKILKNLLQKEALSSMVLDDLRELWDE